MNVFWRSEIEWGVCNLPPDSKIELPEIKPGDYVNGMQFIGILSNPYGAGFLSCMVERRFEFCCPVRGPGYAKISIPDIPKEEFEEMTQHYIRFTATLLNERNPILPDTSVVIDPATNPDNRICNSDEPGN